MLSAQLEEERRAVAAAESESDALRTELGSKQAELTSLQERNAALEIELSQTLEEVLRAKASVRGVHSRALATSRISEVRVQLGSVPGSGGAEVAARIARAESFLERADREFERDNYGGASYLADRASELVLQARAVREVRRGVSTETGPITPIVPPRPLTVLANSNLREGPGVDRARVGGVDEGETVQAVARSGEWFRVETDSGLTAWILGRLVEQPR